MEERIYSFFAVTLAKVRLEIGKKGALSGRRACLLEANAFVDDAASDHTCRARPLQEATDARTSILALLESVVEGELVSLGEDGDEEEEERDEVGDGH